METMDAKREMMLLALMILFAAKGTSGQNPHCPYDGELVEVTCSSLDLQLEVCTVGDGIKVIQIASVAVKHSDSACNFFYGNPEESTNPDGEYGFTQNHLWVNKGCQATFKMCLAIPACPGKWEEVNCSSSEYKYKACPVGDGTSIILYATAVAIHSEAKCNYFFKNYLFYRGDNGDYGHKKNILWVDNGCQATFNICLVPGCPGTLKKVSCKSWHYQYNECVVPDAGTIIYATVLDKQSDSECNSMGSSTSPIGYPQDPETAGIFGYQYDTLWVDSGCQADFEVCYSDPCIIRGDPHMETLDTKKYMYGGKGSYYLVFDTTSNFNIIGEFFMCRENHPHVSCLDVLIINYDNYTIKLERVNNVYVDVGPKILPYVSDDEKINIFKIPEGIKVELANGISIFWDGKKYARINIPISFQGIIMGLCGTYDFNILDDFMLPNGVVVDDVNIFGDSWKAPAMTP